jgi:hypothetical protein
MNLTEVGYEGVDCIHVILGKGSMSGFCEDGNEPSGSIKIREFLEQLRRYQFLKTPSPIGLIGESALCQWGERLGHVYF